MIGRCMPHVRCCCELQSPNCDPILIFITKRSHLKVLVLEMHRYESDRVEEVEMNALPCHFLKDDAKNIGKADETQLAENRSQINKMISSDFEAFIDPCVVFVESRPTVNKAF